MHESSGEMDRGCSRRLLASHRSNRGTSALPRAKLLRHISGDIPPRAGNGTFSVTAQQYMACSVSPIRRLVRHLAGTTCPRIGVFDFGILWQNLG